MVSPNQTPKYATGAHPMFMGMQWTETQWKWFLQNWDRFGPPALLVFAGLTLFCLWKKIEFSSVFSLYQY